MQRSSSLLLATLLAFFPAAAWSQRPDPNGQNSPAPPPRDGMQVMPAGPGAMAVRVGGPMFGRDALGGVIMTLGEANLHPGFNLTDEQKRKIQSIREDFKYAMEQWRTEHAEELKALDEQQRELFADMHGGGGPPDPDQMRDLSMAWQELMETAPDGQAQAEQVKAVLTPEQLQKFEEVQATLDKQREEMMRRMPFRMGPGGGRR